MSTRRSLLFAAVTLPIWSGAARAVCPAEAIRISRGTAIQPVVAGAPPGSAFCLGAGVHLRQSIIPRDRQKFYGEQGTVLNGARRLTQFNRANTAWVAAGQFQRGLRWHPEACLPEWPRCAHPESVYIDDKPLRQAAALSSLAPGLFFLDYRTGSLYLGDDPSGHTVEASTSPYAFLGGAKGVLIQDMTVEKYSTPLQFGAIGYNRASKGWIIRNNEVRLNHGSAIVAGDNSRIVGNHIHDNGQLGIGCVGRDIRIEENEIDWNGYFSGVNPYWEGGGGKCAMTTHLQVRRNHSHDNQGMGFWTDFDNIYTLYEDNLIERNSSGGISHEISYDAVIRGNVLRANGPREPTWLWGGAIQIQNSRNVLVEDNSVDMTGGGNGICLVEQRRGAGRYGPYITTGNVVQRNTITGRTPGHGTSGAIAEKDSHGMRDGNNVFSGNIYRVPDVDHVHWAWIDGMFNWADYRRISGQDATGILEEVEPQ